MDYPFIKCLHLTNEQRTDLDKAFRKATREQYQAVKVSLDHAKEMLKQARYNSDHQAIKFWTDQVESLSRSFKNVTSGVAPILIP
jgi:ribosome recycling factor